MKSKKIEREVDHTNRNRGGGMEGGLDGRKVNSPGSTHPTASPSNLKHR